MNGHLDSHGLFTRVALYCIIVFVIGYVLLRFARFDDDE